MFDPTYTISNQLLNTIKRATLLVHDLNQQLISEVVLAELKQEATAVSTYASNSIEGNPLPLTEVRRLLKNQPQQIRQSEREILNYNQVLVALSEDWSRPFTKSLLLEIHSGLMKGILLAHQAGHWRQEPVVVHNPQTREVIYLPPDWEDVESLIADLVSFVQAKQTIMDPMILAGLVHKQLVIIHPFVDGNGRTTRLATNILLAGLGLNIFNLFSFENYYNQNVSRYFQQVGLLGNYTDLVETITFNSWLEYFAEGVLDELYRVEKQILSRPLAPDMRLKPFHQLILDLIDEHGSVTDREYAKLTERAKATRALDFKKLIELGIIVRLGKGPGTYYQRSSP